MNQQSQPSPPILGLVLHQLVIGRPAAEPGRQNLFESTRKIAIGQCHASDGELLEAADTVEVRAPAQRLEGAAARPSVEQALVPERHVEHCVGCGGA